MTFKVIRGQSRGQEMTQVPYRDYFFQLLHTCSQTVAVRCSAVQCGLFGWLLLQRLERFISGCNETASHLLSMTDEVLAVRDLPRTVLEARSLVSRHDQYVAAVLRLPVVSRLTEDTQHTAQTELLAQLTSDVTQQFGQHVPLMNA